MREVGFGRGALDVEARDFGANALNGSPRLADVHFLSVERGAKRLRLFVGDPNLVTQLVEGPEVLGQPRLRSHDRFGQLAPSRLGAAHVFAP